MVTRLPWLFGDPESDPLEAALPAMFAVCILTLMIPLALLTVLVVALAAVGNAMLPPT